MNTLRTTNHPRGTHSGGTDHRCNEPTPEVDPNGGVTLRRTLLAAVAALAMSATMVVTAPAAQATHDPCNMSSWKWPVCEISIPSIPRVSVEGPRPALTPKTSAWCQSSYIKASASGYVYWSLTQNRKVAISFWPDYYSRYYQLMYWTGSKWAWVPVNSSFPNVPLGQRIYCGT
jgi:hypothetical protein